MLETNRTVLETIEAQCLTPEARARILTGVLTAVERAPTPRVHGGRRS
jgi:hypothetical protein